MSRAIKLARMGDAGRQYMYPYGGDPGLFGSILGGIKKIGGAALGLVPGGGVVKTLARGVGGALNVLRNKSAGPGQLVAPPGWSPTPATLTLGPSGRSLPLAPPGQLGPGFQEPGTVAYTDVVPAIACPVGYRPNKSAYYRRTPQGNIVYHKKGTVCVRRRRRNPLNPRALSRSLARVGSAKRAVMKVLAVRVTTGKKPKLIIRRKKAP